MKKIAAIGEVMVELSPFPAPEYPERELFSVSFAGDTYNTAVYMARLGLHTTYLTRLGDDAYSTQILQRMANENIATDLIERVPGRSPGLYAIRNTADGEREFSYWRKEAPARELFNSAQTAAALCNQLKAMDCVYISGITLAIIGAQSRAYLYTALGQLRDAGVTIAFDSNYRPRLWASTAEAQEAMLAIMQLSDIALLTLDDENLLWGDASVAGCKSRYHHCPLRELIIKRGAEEAIIISSGNEQSVPVPPVTNVIDTTGAGDTFNAGYLAARLQGATPEVAVKQAIRCAGIIIRHRGAIIDKAVFHQELTS